jgi:type II secretory pathway component GspD/PulD (secretin)
MKGIILLNIVICFSVLGLQGEEKPAPSDTSSPTVTVEWVDKSLRDALEIISEIAQVNIIIDLRITNEDKVTLTLRNLSWQLALEETVRAGTCILEEINPTLFRVNKPPTISMDIKDSPLDEVIRHIAKLAGISVIISADVKGTVTIRLTDVPWLDALQSIIKTAGFSIVQEKYNVVRIIKTEALAEQLETRVFQLKYLRPPGWFKANIKTPYAVGAVKATTDMVKEFTLLNILKNMLSRKGNTIIGNLEYDLKSNSIIVQDTKVVLDAMEKVIERLDVPIEQVLIGLKFVSTTNEDLLQYGLKYSWGGTKEPKSDVMTVRPEPASIKTTLPLGFGRRQDSSFNQFFLNSYDVSVILRLLKSDTKSKFIQEPNLVALDGEEATVFVGEQIRYPHTKLSFSPTGNPIYELAEAGNSPVNIGFQLWVTPNIVKGTNRLIITLIPTLEDLSGSDIGGFETYETGGQSIRLPRTRQSTIVTRLLIDSGQTAIIGGLLDERTTDTVEKVPVLGNIPLISPLFRYTGKATVNRKLLVFLSPHIIKTAETTNEILKEKIKDIK